ncbi:MAG: carbon storage regulator [Planctomycetota bacterium]
MRQMEKERTRTTRLVLTRREGDGIRVTGPATFRVDKIRGGRVKVVVEAEPDVRIVRTELLRRSREEA